MTFFHSQPSLPLSTKYLPCPKTTSRPTIPNHKIAKYHLYHLTMLSMILYNCASKLSEMIQTTMLKISGYWPNSMNPREVVYWAISRWNVSWRIHHFERLCLSSLFMPSMIPESVLEKEANKTSGGLHLWAGEEGGEMSRAPPHVNRSTLFLFQSPLRFIRKILLDFSIDT